jgi:hypothetical protein
MEVTIIFGSVFMQLSPPKYTIVQISIMFAKYCDTILKLFNFFGTKFTI